MAGAVGYARVSTDEQARENNSLPLQKTRIAAYCESVGLPVAKMLKQARVRARCFVPDSRAR